MRLESYVRDVLRDDKHGDVFPETLTLVADLVGEFNALYSKGEKGACEYGRSMGIGEDYASIVLGGEHHSAKYEANMVIPDLLSDGFFGDVHSHPTDSIGEAGGWAAHSMEDCLAIASHKEKRLFIGFVVTGPRIYAMAYRKGLTKIDEGHINGLRAKIESGLKAQYLAEAWKGDEEAFVDWQQKKFMEFMDMGLKSEEDNAAALRKAMVENKRAHVKFSGRLGQNLTVSSCKELAEKDGFGFYMSAGPGSGTSDRDLTRPKEPGFLSKIGTGIWSALWG